MTVGIASASLNAWLNAFARNVAYTQPAAFWLKLHLADPGAAGTTSPAANTTRQQATFSAASAGSLTTSADIVWTNVPNAETYSHISYWDASSAGTFLGSSALTVARLVAVGDTFTILAGSETIGITPVAA
jgi:hypothetical protein